MPHPRHSTGGGYKAKNFDPYRSGRGGPPGGVRGPGGPPSGIHVSIPGAGARGGQPQRQQGPGRDQGYSQHAPHSGGRDNGYGGMQGGTAGLVGHAGYGQAAIPARGGPGPTGYDRETSASNGYTLANGYQQQHRPQGRPARQDIPVDRPPPPANFVTGKQKSKNASQNPSARPPARQDQVYSGDNGYGPRIGGGRGDQGVTSQAPTEAHTAYGARGPQDRRMSMLSGARPTYETNQSAGTPDRSPAVASTPTSRASAVHPSRLAQVPYAQIVRSSPYQTSLAPTVDRRPDGIMPNGNHNGVENGISTPSRRPDHRPPPVDVSRAAYQTPQSQRQSHTGARNGLEDDDRVRNGNSGQTEQTGMTAMAGRFLASDNAVPITPVTWQALGMSSGSGANGWGSRDVRDGNVPNHGQSAAAHGQTAQNQSSNRQSGQGGANGHDDSSVHAEPTGPSSTTGTFDTATASTPTPASKSLEAKKAELKAKLLAAKQRKADSMSNSPALPSAEIPAAAATQAPDTAAGPGQDGAETALPGAGEGKGTSKADSNKSRGSRAAGSVTSTDPSVVSSGFNGALPRTEPSVLAQESAFGAPTRDTSRTVQNAPSGPSADRPEPTTREPIKITIPPTAPAAKRDRESESDSTPLVEMQDEMEEGEIEPSSPAEPVSKRPRPSDLPRNAPSQPFSSTQSGSGGRSRRPGAEEFMADGPVAIITDLSPGAHTHPPTQHMSGNGVRNGNGHVQAGTMITADDAEASSQDRGHSKDPAAQERARIWKDKQCKAKEEEIAKVQAQSERTKREMLALADDKREGAPEHGPKQARDGERGASGQRVKRAVYRGVADELPKEQRQERDSASRAQEEEGGANANGARKLSLLERMGSREDPDTRPRLAMDSVAEDDAGHRAQQHKRRASRGAHDQYPTQRTHSAKPYDRPAGERTVKSDQAHGREWDRDRERDGAQFSPHRPSATVPAISASRSASNRPGSLRYADKYGNRYAQPIPVGPQDGYDGYSFAARGGTPVPPPQAGLDLAPGETAALNGAQVNGDESPYSKAERARQDQDQQRGEPTVEQGTIQQTAPAPMSNSQTNEVMETLALLKAQIARLEASLPQTAATPAPTPAALPTPALAHATPQHAPQVPPPRARASSSAVHPDRAALVPGSEPARHEREHAERHHPYAQSTRYDGNTAYGQTPAAGPAALAERPAPTDAGAAPRPSLSTAARRLEVKGERMANQRLESRERAIPPPSMNGSGRYEDRSQQDARSPAPPPEAPYHQPGGYDKGAGKGMTQHKAPPLGAGTDPRYAPRLDSGDRGYGQSPVGYAQPGLEWREEDPRSAAQSSFPVDSRPPISKRPAGYQAQDRFNPPQSERGPGWGNAASGQAQSGGSYGNGAGPSRARDDGAGAKSQRPSGSGAGGRQSQRGGHGARGGGESRGTPRGRR